MFEIYFIIFICWGCSKFLHLKVHKASESMDIIHTYLHDYIHIMSVNYYNCIIVT